MPQKPHKNFKASTAAETRFARALRQVARQAGHVVEVHAHGGHRIYQESEMVRRLKDYSEALDPWARRQAAKMLEQVSKKNRAAYTKKSKQIGKILREQVVQSHVGMIAADLMQEQVELIKSIPLKAAERAQKLALEAAVNGSRASEIAEELARSGRVSESTANLIARTEVARANASFNQARAMSVGSTQYRWRNSGDAAVRESHKRYHGKKLDGMVFSWDEPPTLDDGTTGHPGTFPNCRCYAEPFFDDDDVK